MARLAQANRQGLRGSLHREIDGAMVRFADTYSLLSCAPYREQPVPIAAPQTPSAIGTFLAPTYKTKERAQLINRAQSRQPVRWEDRGPALSQGGCASITPLRTVE